MSQTLAVNSGLRNYMLSVYNHMSMGVLVTALISYFLSVTPDVMAVFTSGLMFWVVLLAPLGIVLAMSLGFQKFSTGALMLMFYALAALFGCSLSTIFLVYTTHSIFVTLFVTVAAFAGLSAYGYTTTRDLTGMGAFLTMGLFGLLAALVVNLFLGSNTFDFVISIAGVLIFSGLIMFDTQKLKELYTDNVDETNAKLAIMGALTLYLDFINLFLFLLRFLGVKTKD